jgi:hypothetical protein
MSRTITSYIVSEKKDGRTVFPISMQDYWDEKRWRRLKKKKKNQKSVVKTEWGLTLPVKYEI